MLSTAEVVGNITAIADLSDGFFVAMRAVAAYLHTQPRFLLGVMNSESDIRAAAHNPNGHASGLIQFMQVLGLYSGLTGLAVLGGPVVGGAIVQGVAWHWIFWPNIAIGLSARRSLFNGITPSATGLKTVLLWSFGNRLQHVDDFENPAANLTGGTRRLIGGALVEDFGSIPIGGTSINDHVLEQSHVVHADTTANPAAPLGVETTLPPVRHDLSAFTVLAVDVGAFFDTTSPNTIATGPFPTFTVELHDAAGGVARLDATRFSPAMSRPFFHRLRTGQNVTALRLETVHVALAQFRGVDLRTIVAIQVVASPPNGHLFIDHIKLATL
jgi:hypothetical protein